MLLLKFSLMTLFLIPYSFGMSFSSQVCLMGQFDTNIQNEGEYFGLLKNNLSITKDQCNIKVKYKRLLETEWKVDICREPVHIKVLNKGKLEVFKRKGSCDERSDQFCDSWAELKKTLQDQGLIFAEGERENLQSAHGKTYCVYLLLNKYLEEGILFSKYKNPVDIFVNSPKSVKKEQPKDEEVKEETPSESNEVKARF
jgi:hypothetical protein